MITNEFNDNTKILSIDSDDRNINTFENANNFEIICPQTYNNVHSIKLLNFSIPSTIYNISEYLQNNKIYIHDILITIDDGCYNNENIVHELNNKIANHDSISHITCIFYSNTQKIIFKSNTNSNFKIDFTKIIQYNTSSFCNNNIFNQHTNWGLGAVLGFDKKLYDNSNNYISPSQINLYHYDNIYFYLNYFNNSDTIQPYKINYNTNNTNGIINSCFAKLDISKMDYNNLINTSQILLTNTIEIFNNNILKTPIQKLNKLSFSIKYHNGLLVDIPKNKHIIFTLAIN